MTARTMTVGQVIEALARWDLNAPVMINPTGDPDDMPVALSHLGRGAVLAEGEAPRPYLLLVVAPAMPGLVAEDVPAGEAVAP